MKSVKKTYWIVLIFSALLSAIVLYLKLQAEIPNFAERTFFLLFLAPIVLLIGILLPYYIYGRTVKKTEKFGYEEKLKKFTIVQKVKYYFFGFVAIFLNLVMFLYYKTDFLYSLGIVLIFFIIEQPTDYKFRRDFLKEFDLEKKKNENPENPNGK